jgi:hypothetical protein
MEKGCFISLADKLMFKSGSYIALIGKEVFLGKVAKVCQ